MFVAAIDNIPVVRDDQVTLDQLLEFRKDSEARNKYRKLRLWLGSSIHADTVSNASEIIAQRIENYEWAIRKHGLETYRSAIEYIINQKSLLSTTMASTLGALLGGPIAAELMGGTVLLGQVSAYLLERKVAIGDIEPGEH